MKNAFSFLLFIALSSPSRADLAVKVSHGHYPKPGNTGFNLKHFDLAPTHNDCTDIAPGRLFRGGYPLSKNGSLLPLTVQTLQANKVDIVLDVRHENLSQRKIEKATLESVGIEYKWFPLRTDIPKGKSLKSLNNAQKIADGRLLVESLLRELRSGKNIYIHCTRGEDRSGTLIALLRLWEKPNCTSWKKEFGFSGYGGVMYTPLKDFFNKMRAL